MRTIIINKIKDSNMNNSSIKKIALSLTVASLFSGTAFANSDTNENVIKKVQSSMPAFSQLIRQYDTDKNETLNAKEVVRSMKLTKAFELIDVNKDKEISNNEYSIYVESMKKSVS